MSVQLNDDITTLPPSELDSEPDDEVDQLDSDSEPEPGKKNGSPVEQRPAGQTWLPEDRIQSMVQADGVTGNLALSKEAIFILSAATEEFIKRLTQGAQRQASAERRHTLSYCDMSATTQQYQEFMFLRETIPTPLSLSEALQLRQQREKELIDEDPALGAPASQKPSTSTTYASASKIKARIMNGIDKPKKQQQQQQQQQQKPTVTTFDSTYTFPPAASYYRDSARLPVAPLPQGQTHSWNTRDSVVGILDARPWTNWSNTPLGATHTGRLPVSRFAQNGHARDHLPGMSGTFSVQSLNNGHVTSLPVPTGTVNNTASPVQPMQVDPQPTPPPPPLPPSSETPKPPPVDEPTRATTTKESTPLTDNPDTSPFGSSQNPGRTIYSQQRTPQP